MKLSLIGAGPGHPGLITLAAIETLKAADVVLYDALANDHFLQYVQPQTEVIFVGKRKGIHSVSQAEINRIIVQNLMNGLHVVRLKGGDPMLFGRGFEEIDMAEALGASTNLVPGISSALSVPAWVGIPLTKRGVSNGLWILTGHTSEGALPADLPLAAQSNCTVVILMGMAKLLEICQIFEQNGKANLAAAIIQNGTLPTEKIILGKVNNINSLALENQISNPAIIVFGHCIEHRMEEINHRIMETHA